MRLQLKTEQSLQCPVPLIVIPQTNICNEDWQSEWEYDLSELLRESEEAEQALSYLSPCRSEEARKKLGSYYTPADAAGFFWNEFFALNGIEGGERARQFWREHHFIEPSAGAGALIFALIKKGVDLGVPMECLAKIELTVIDINQAALNFIQDQLALFAQKWGIKFENISFICSDFRRCKIPYSSRIPLFFGNPPFVANPKGTSDWKNLFADFLEISLNRCGNHGRCHFILPVSLAFSRDYSRLRKKIVASGKSVALSSFDNIPDTLFPSGKPEHTNTNKANSQRCTILTVFPAEVRRILVTKMHRWSKYKRSELLSSAPEYYDVTNYTFDDQFPRPENGAILRYIEESQYAKRFHMLTSKNGKYSLFVASVARNFIGFREEDASSVHHLRFNTQKEKDAALLLLSSDIFMDYWRTVGDGFHVTKTNIFEFPLHHCLLFQVNSKSAMGRKMWKNRAAFAKRKKHPNGMTVSYDFSAISLEVENLFEHDDLKQAVA